MFDLIKGLDFGWELLSAAGVLLAFAIPIATILCVLALKKNSTAALAWCLVVVLLPIMGPLLFAIFGYQHVHRPLKRKRRHRTQFLNRPGPPGATDPSSGSNWDLPEPREEVHPMVALARRLGAAPLTYGNSVTLYHEGEEAFHAMLEAIGRARHHIHVEFFIIQPDEFGAAFFDTLAKKAAEGVRIRVLYDAIGSHRLKGPFLGGFQCAGGRCSVFLPLNPWRQRFQVNMRNHRKIVVVDGETAFTGGLNIGKEYLGKDPRYGYWRDTHIKIEGPAVLSLQRVFTEDWDFAAQENLLHAEYFPEARVRGNVPVQVVESGPDNPTKTIREIYFAAILQATRRLWIATPYFVPDEGILDALRLAARRGVDVRILGLFHADRWIPLFAARYFWGDMIDAGVKIYQYSKGMMHSKVVLVDDAWASVGTANMDNRSLHLNFEVNCLLYSRRMATELEEMLIRDFDHSIRLEPQSFANRPWAGRMAENACRLMSPVL